MTTRRNHLVPTVTVNKNGVTTTVHKKPLRSSTTSNSLPFPAAPVLPTRSLTDEQRSNMISSMHRWIGIIHEGSDLDTGKAHSDTIRDQLLTYSDNALIAVNEYLLSDVEDSLAFRHRTAFLTLLSDPRYRDNGNTIHEYLTFKEVIPPTANVRDGLTLIRPLHGYKQLPIMDSYADADQETQEQVVALITVTQDLLNKYNEHQRDILSAATTTGMHSWDEFPAMPAPLELGLPINTDKNVRLVGDDLISLIVEQPENAQAISRAIVNDGINDSALLREIFDSNIPSLRDGLI